MDPREVGRQRIAVWQGVANAAAERIDHVLFRMAVGREIDPLPAPALPAIVLKSVLQPNAARRFEGSNRGRHHGGATASSPDGPSTITSRISATVGAIRQPSFMVPSSTRC